MESRDVRVFFVTDLHGSTLCFKKFLSGLDVYEADAGIMAGDLTGKYLVPIVESQNERYVYSFHGRERCINGDEELNKLLEWLARYGAYGMVISPGEMAGLGKGEETLEVVATSDYQAQKELEDRFWELAKERLRSWGSLAQERLKGKNTQVFVSAGNDDSFGLDDVLRSTSAWTFCDQKRVDVLGHEMISLSWSNRTPWKTPRETGEERLQEMIELLTMKIERAETSIFNFHVPPKGTTLDQAPKLSKDLVPSVAESEAVGSEAVLRAIHEFQPLLGLHGHIHESMGFQELGRTFCVNPGSEYSEGILRGVIITLSGASIKNFLFVSG